MKVTLRQVTLADAQFLYNLLAERPSYANISHLKMPSMDEHKAFIAAKPYAHWYVIQGKQSHRIGAVYLTRQNEIGIAISSEHQGKGHAKHAIEELMQLHPKPRYLAHIAPDNYLSHNLFKGMGFHLIQNTLALDRLSNEDPLERSS